MDMPLYDIVANSTAHRKSRDDAAFYVLQNPQLASELISLALDGRDKHHYKACWILEIVLEKNLGLIGQRLTEFCDVLPTFKNGSAVRSIAKVCLFCVEQSAINAAFLTPEQIVKITDACFSWLISDEKVAVKALAIKTLFHTGKKLDWVHPELIAVLEHDFASGSPGYKAVARKILYRLRK